MGMQLVGRISAGDEQLDEDLRDIDIVTGDAGTFLYASTGQNGGISVYHLHPDGSLASLADSTHFNVWGMAVGQFDAINLDGQAQLVLGGTGDGKLIRYRIEDDGGLSKSGKIDLPGPTTQSHSTLVATSLNSDQTAVYSVDAQTGVLSGWLSSGTGGLTKAAGLRGDAAAFDLAGPVALDLAQVGNTRFLLAADSGTQGVHSYRVGPKYGILKAVDSLGAADGLGVALPTALETVTAHGATWVVLAAAGSSSLSVMQLSATGQLTPTDHILDTRATRFADVAALEVVEVDGHVFVLAGGADDGLSLFSLLPGGHLVHMQTLVHDTGLSLVNITGITAARIGNELQIFVTSGTAAGLSQFSLSLADLGAVIEAGQGPAGGNIPLSGTGESDLLMGHAGDDILVSDASGGILTGGDGADLFVLHPTDRLLQITDFTAGIDQLDLTQFPMLRSVQQLTLTPTDTGITIGFGSTLIDIRSRDGTPLTAQDLWPDGFATPDRIPILPPSTKLLALGTSGDDVVVRGATEDRIRALAGNDQVLAGAGADTVFGGGGNDLLRGAAGRDRLFGGTGKDDLHGGAGADRLFGNAGKDTLSGKGGRDWLAGQLGDDWLTGGAGADRFIFEQRHGADTITDFTPDLDRIRFNINDLDFADLQIRALGADTLIDTGAGTITLIGLDPDVLDADDFLFL